MAAKLHTATAQGAIEYLDSLVIKNRAPASVVSPLKTALSKVLQRTEGEEWGKTDLIDLDVGDIMMRFKNLTPTDYTEGSYRNYEMRLKKAIGWYLKFLQTPGWVPPENSRVAVKPGVEQPAAPEVSNYVSQAEVEASEAITYPFPLESGKMASLHIPRDITADDVRRLHGFLDALVIRKEEGSGEA